MGYAGDGLTQGRSAGGGARAHPAQEPRTRGPHATRGSRAAGQALRTYVMKGNTLNGSRRRLISVVAATATIAGVVATSSVASAAATGPSPKPAPASQAMTDLPAAPVEKVIVTYKSKSAEAGSNTAAKNDAAAKGKETGESLSFEIGRAHV